MSPAPFAATLAERLPELTHPARPYDATVDCHDSWRVYIAYCRALHQAGKPLPPSAYLGNGGGW